MSDDQGKSQPSEAMRSMIDAFEEAAQRVKESNARCFIFIGVAEDGMTLRAVHVLPGTTAEDAGKLLVEMGLQIHMTQKDLIEMHTSEQSKVGVEHLIGMLGEIGEA